MNDVQYWILLSLLIILGVSIICIVYLVYRMFSLEDNLDEERAKLLKIKADNMGLKQREAALDETVEEQRDRIVDLVRTIKGSD